VCSCTRGALCKYSVGKIDAKPRRIDVLHTAVEQGEKARFSVRIELQERTSSVCSAASGQTITWPTSCADWGLFRGNTMYPIGGCEHAESPLVSHRGSMSSVPTPKLVTKICM